MTPSPNPASWLFLKGDETIWVLRSPGGHIAVCGPGTAREDYSFDSPMGMEAFQVSFAERLMASGWVLWGVDRERRAGHERRSAHRETPDRRAPVNLDAGGYLS
jgi:hypothetical protein